MKFVKTVEAVSNANSESCSVLEYPLGDKDMDLAVATITGRYPEKGYCVNLACKELVYVLEGSGSLCLKNEKVDFSEGDSILINCEEEYYWNAKYCKVTISCTPPWNKNQYRVVD